jgi:NAD+-dependent secondary alcohol dehydrogenase Adh1
LCISGHCWSLTTEGGGMKAARLHEYREHVGPESLKVEEVEEPKITGPSDVIVRVGGAGLCRTDLHIVEGQLKDLFGPALPYTLGHENAGWVEEVGSAVTNVAPGDTVITHPLANCGSCRACRAGNDMYCADPAFFSGFVTDGGFAQLLKTGSRAVVKLTPSHHPKDIAALADAGLAAYHAVRKAKDILTPGTKAVVIGAGGLGHIGVQCLKALTPAEVIVLDTSEAALDLAKGLGADHTVRVDGNEVAAVRELTGGLGAEAVVDFVGEDASLASGIPTLRQGGTYYLVGYGGTLHVPTAAIIAAEISFVGNLIGSYRDLLELMDLTAQGEVTLHTSAYPLDAINDAVADLNEGKLRGRAILVPEDAA